MKALEALNRSGEIAELWQRLESLGVRFNNSNWNTRLEIMCCNDQFVEALEITQLKLMKGYRILQQHLEEKKIGQAKTIKGVAGEFYLQQKTLAAFSKVYNERSEVVRSAEKLTDVSRYMSDFNRVRSQCPDVFEAIRAYRAVTT